MSIYGDTKHTEWFKKAWAKTYIAFVQSMVGASGNRPSKKAAAKKPAAKKPDKATAPKSKTARR